MAPDGARVILATHIAAGDAAGRNLLQMQGMTETRHAWQMEIELDRRRDAPHWPDGIVVRTRRPGEERAIYKTERTSFKDHWGYMEEPFEEGFAWWKHRTENKPHCDPSLWFLTEEKTEIAGFSIASPRMAGDPDMGWIWSIGVLRPWRRRGLGLALSFHTFDRFFRRGIKHAALGVDAQNLTGETRLYEKAGMHVAHEYIRFEKESRSGQDLSTRSLDLD